MEHVLTWLNLSTLPFLIYIFYFYKKLLLLYSFISFMKKILLIYFCSIIQYSILIPGAEFKLNKQFDFIYLNYDKVIYKKINNNSICLMLFCFFYSIIKIMICNFRYISQKSNELDYIVYIPDFIHIRIHILGRYIIYNHIQQQHGIYDVLYINHIKRIPLDQYYPPS